MFTMSFRRVRGEDVRGGGVRGGRPDEPFSGDFAWNEETENRKSRRRQRHLNHYNGGGVGVGTIMVVVVVGGYNNEEVNRAGATLLFDR